MLLATICVGDFAAVGALQDLENVGLRRKFNDISLASGFVLR
jgi:hypothetical protein